MPLDAFWLPVVEECSVEQLEARLQLLQDYSCVGVQHQRKKKLRKGLRISLPSNQLHDSPP